MLLKIVRLSSSPCAFNGDLVANARFLIKAFWNDEFFDVLFLGRNSKKLLANICL